MRIFKLLLPLTVIALLGLLVWHPHDYNTEQVCFNESGDMIFYAAGYKPSSSPVIHLAGNNYKHLRTGGVIKGECQTRWGVNPPRGIDYWLKGDLNGL